MSSPNQNETGGNTGAPENKQDEFGHDVNMSQQQQVEVHFDSPVRRNLQAALTSDSDFILSAASSVETTPTPTAFLGHSSDDSALAMAAGLIHSGTNAAPFGSPQDGMLSGENIDLSSSFQQPTPSHSLATSPYNPGDDDESDIITPITNNNMPVIDEQNSNMDSPPAESVVSGRLNNNELSPPVLDSASVASKSFVEDDVSRNSGSIGGIGGGNGGIRPRRGRVRSWDQTRSGAANNDMFMTGLQQPHLDDVPEESSYGGGAPPFRGGGEGVPPVGLGGPPPHPLAASTGAGGIGRNNPNRPPRAPPLPPQPRPHGHHVGHVQFSHRRGASLGDHSILSVLTESSLEEGDAGTGSRRKTSWDFDDASPRLPPMSILQPVLSEGNLMGLDFEAEGESVKETDVDAKQTLLDLPVFSGTPAPTVPPGAEAEAEANTNDNPISPQLKSPPGRKMEFSNSTETYAATNTTATKENIESKSKDDLSSGDFKGVATKVITVTDVAASPHEEEAETSILKAIEQRDSERKEKERRSISKASTKVAGMNDSEAERATSALAENENASGGRESAKQHNETVQPPTPFSPRNVTRNTGNKMVDLTEQLMMMQTMNISIRGKGGHRTEHVDELVSPKEFSTPTSSSTYFGVDALANDGAQLFRRSNHRQPGSLTNNGSNSTTAQAEGARTAQMRWGVIREAVVTSSTATKEKVDEESGGGGDIENQRDKTSRENATADGAGAPDHGNGARSFRDKGRRELREIGHAVKEEVSPKKGRILLRAKWFLAIVLPSLLVASVLFYALKNPLVCTHMEEGDPCASWSWWIIFVGIRQPITLVVARVVEVFAVNIFSLRTRITLRMWGPFVTLWIVQSKGWPALLTIWGIVDFIVLYGRSKWTNHWLFWQHAVDMCNANNPAGLVLDSSTYTRVLSAAITAGVLTGLKRLWLSSYLGTRTCGKFLTLHVRS